MILKTKVLNKYFISITSCVHIHALYVLLEDASRMRVPFHTCMLHLKIQHYHWKKLQITEGLHLIFLVSSGEDGHTDLLQMAVTSKATRLLFFPLKICCNEILGRFHTTAPNPHQRPHNKWAVEGRWLRFHVQGAEVEIIYDRTCALCIKQTPFMCDSKWTSLKLRFLPAQFTESDVFIGENSTTAALFPPSTCQMFLIITWSQIYFTMKFFF